MTPLGNPYSRGQLRITSLDNSGDSIRPLKSTVRTRDDGTYSFNLLPGKYSIELLVCDKWNHVATITVGSGSTGTKTLQELIQEAGEVD